MATSVFVIVLCAIYLARCWLSHYLDTKCVIFANAFAKTNLHNQNRFSPVVESLLSQFSYWYKIMSTCLHLIRPSRWRTLANISRGNVTLLLCARSLATFIFKDEISSLCAPRRRRLFRYSSSFLVRITLRPDAFMSWQLYFWQIQIFVRAQLLPTECTLCSTFRIFPSFRDFSRNEWYAQIALVPNKTYHMFSRYYHYD